MVFGSTYDKTVGQVENLMKKLEVAEKEEAQSARLATSKMERAKAEKEHFEKRAKNAAKMKEKLAGVFE